MTTKLAAVKPGAFDIFSAVVHPAASMFSIDEETLAELIDDIRERGQQDPIRLSHDREIVDGRSRLEACRRLGIEPKYEVLPDGIDIEAFIFSANVLRRSLSAGQRAMAHVLLHKDEEKSKGGRGNKTVESFNGLDRADRSRARAILEELGEAKAREVLSGALAFNSAYKDALDERGKRNERDALIKALPPHIAGRLASGELSISEAVRIRDLEEEERKRVNAMVVAAANRFIDVASFFSSKDAIASLRAYLETNPATADGSLIKRSSEAAGMCADFFNNGHFEQLREMLDV